MTITGMAHFESVCKKKLVEWYNRAYTEMGLIDVDITLDNVFVVLSRKTFQNYEAVLSTNVVGDGICAVYTFDGNKGKLYEVVFRKLTDDYIKEE